MANDKKRITQEHPIKLSPEAVEHRSSQLAKLIQERTAIETALASYGADKRKRLREIKKEEKRLANEVADKVGLAEVACEEEYVFSQNKVIVRRLDTNEIVSERAMTGEERQTSIAVPGANAKRVELEDDDEEDDDDGPGASPSASPAAAPAVSAKGARGGRGRGGARGAKH